MKSSIRRQITSKLAQGVQKIPEKTLARQIGSLAQKRIVERTEQGKFLGGRLANTGYSKGYARFRLANKRRIDKVTLLYTGRMLGGLGNYLKQNKNSISITIRVLPMDQAKANYTHSERNWLAMSNSEIDTLFNYIENRINKVL